MGLVVTMVRAVVMATKAAGAVGATTEGVRRGGNDDSTTRAAWTRGWTRRARGAVGMPEEVMSVERVEMDKVEAAEKVEDKGMVVEMLEVLEMEEGRVVSGEG